MSVVLIDPSDSVVVEIDWSDALVAGVTLSAVTHSLPSPLVKVAESNDTDSSSVRVSGALHGATYLVEASATLSTGETLNRQFPLRCFNG